MPWQTRSIVNIREELGPKALAGEENKVDIAEKFGVSRKTVYKWLDRYKERGLTGLVDESRRPRSSPMMTSPSSRSRSFSCARRIGVGGRRRSSPCWPGNNPAPQTR